MTVLVSTLLHVSAGCSYWDYETAVSNLFSVSIVATAFKGLLRMPRIIELISAFLHVSNCLGLGDTMQ